MKRRLASVVNQIILIIRKGSIKPHIGTEKFDRRVYMEIITAQGLIMSAYDNSTAITYYETLD